MLGLVYILTSIAISWGIGRGRFFLFKTTGGHKFRHARYGAWVGKTFAGLAAAGLLLLMLKVGFISLGDKIADIADDVNGITPYMLALGMFMVIASLVYRGLVTITHYSERSLRQLKKRIIRVPYKRVDGRIVIRADAILRRLRKELTQARPGREDELDIELDLINITKRAKRKHAERVAPHFKAQPRYSSCRPTEPLTIGNLALEVPSLEPEVSQVPIVNLKPQFIAEAMLESQLEVLAEEDKLLVREFFKAYPLIKRYALMPNVYVRLGIEDAAENSPRRVIILGIVLKGRV